MIGYPSSPVEVRSRARPTEGRGSGCYLSRVHDNGHHTKLSRASGDRRRRFMANLHHLDQPDDLRKAFRKYLSIRGVKYTRARQRILEAVLELTEHFEAEQVLYLLRQRGQKVGKATVYRTLPLLVDCGILRQVRFDVKQAHYEHAFGEGPHDHMVCRRCRRIIEFDSADVARLCAVVAARHKFHALSHRFQITGLCWECVQACPEAERPFIPSDEPPSTEPHRSAR